MHCGKRIFYLFPYNQWTEGSPQHINPNAIGKKSAHTFPAHCDKCSAFNSSNYDEYQSQWIELPIKRTMPMPLFLCLSPIQIPSVSPLLVCLAFHHIRSSIGGHFECKISVIVTKQYRCHVSAIILLAIHWLVCVAHCLLCGPLANGHKHQQQQLFGVCICTKKIQW